MEYFDIVDENNNLTGKQKNEKLSIQLVYGIEKLQFGL